MDPIKLQQDLRNNQEDIQSYMRDLRNWTDQIKKKDKELVTQSKTDNPTESTQSKSSVNSKRPSAPKSLSTTRCVENHRKKMAKGRELSEEVLKLKEAGNECLKNKDYEEAIKHYSVAMNLDPNYHVLPANRGMAYLKLNAYEKAEQDCSKAVALDPEYIKGYLRRGTARLELRKLQLAREDYQQVLKFEPHNPQAKMSLERIELEKAKLARLNATIAESDQSASKDVSTTKISQGDPKLTQLTEKPAYLRSKKPLKKIGVMQVRNDDELEIFINCGHVPLLGNSSESQINETKQLSSMKKELRGAIEEVQKSKETQSLSVGSKKGGAIEVAPTSGKEKHVAQKAEPLAQNPSTSLLTLPSAPRSSYEFVRDWKLLRTHCELRGQYLRQIPPGDYATIFRQALEESTMVEILRMAETLSVVEIGSHLRGLSKVQRVDVLVMFLSPDDRKLLMSLVSRCEADGQDMDDVKKWVSL